MNMTLIIRGKPVEITGLSPNATMDDVLAAASQQIPDFIPANVEVHREGSLVPGYMFANKDIRYVVSEKTG